ncbi:MAG TPA: YdiU family protein [Polyangiaceae bacterium]|nr:YdiU family protein [Polyangiaceae bacterium]
MAPFAFDNTYARLPGRFYSRVAPTPVRDPRLVKLNQPLLRLLGSTPEALQSLDPSRVFSGNEVPAGADPIALAYAGHQFGDFVPQLGDGRAIMLGEVVSGDGVRRDVQLKGAGRTPFSRSGDGRAALGPVLREYVVSEAMAALGIPTTRALAAVTTGEFVIRDTRLPGAVLTRVAASHLRVGTFEYFSVRRDRDALARLVDYALARHFPEPDDSSNPALRLLDRVVERQATLVARWLGVGFIHGVMNTDNTSISGETLDYGPCAFLDDYQPNKTFSSIDHDGRYAFAKQPAMARFNSACLARTLLPLLADDHAVAVRLANERVERFSDLFMTAFLGVFRSKLGLFGTASDDAALIDFVLERLAEQPIDYTNFFRHLCYAMADPSRDAAVATAFRDSDGMLAWLGRWRARLASDGASVSARLDSMRSANPSLIPRNHRIQQAIDAAVQSSDFKPFEELVEALSRPYDEQPRFAHLADPPRPDERVERTFCGT